MSKEHPIIFSTPMVKAILAGRKSQTRRVIKGQLCGCGHTEPEECGNITPEGWLVAGHSGKWWCGSCLGDTFACPFGIPKDLMWVREAWSVCYNGPDAYQIIYTADGQRRDFSEALGTPAAQLDFLEHGMNQHGESGRPSIQMPRWASRLLLEVKQVRVQRLQEISEEDALAEGVKHRVLESSHSKDADGTLHDRMILQGSIPAFHELWDSINSGRGLGWESNPWVFVIDFKAKPW